jgi:hypothetical protein
MLFSTKSTLLAFLTVIVAVQGSAVIPESTLEREAAVYATNVEGTDKSSNLSQLVCPRGWGVCPDRMFIPFLPLHICLTTLQVLRNAVD